ncbi:helix-turn-helix domain-containing protein [Arthrobacter sp. NQ7]|uniref:AraC-like ligand-binding domain-containing protein n=1 Tax=Arthrobacter sp. NQ7 TaxID=3032303 RepID=UPI00240F58F6|nr:helix-turn-helix domain-containing protein [Arthrobacter sp. NQ7]MDJ0460025.1 helix-turn-helix domain-containing protein [Arthrobacter sp. NQ7]
MVADGRPRAVAGWKSLEDWEYVVTSTYAGLSISVDRETDFSARLSLVKLGRCELSRVDSPPATYERSNLHISRAPADDLLLSLKMSGSCVAEQFDRQALLKSGDLVLYDTGSPYKLNFLEGYRELILKIPRAALASRVTSPSAVSAVRLSGRSSIGRLAGSYLRGLAREAENLSPHARAGLDSAILDVVALALSEVDGACAVDENAERLARAKTVMRANIADSALGAARVAAALNISVRTLNRLFAREGESAMRWLLDERLIACQRALSEGRTRSVSDVAMEYGFSDLSHFSRVFRAKFGIRPSEVLALGRPFHRTG